MDQNINRHEKKPNRLIKNWWSKQIVGTQDTSRLETLQEPKKP